MGFNLKINLPKKSLTFKYPQHLLENKTISESNPISFSWGLKQSSRPSRNPKKRRILLIPTWWSTLLQAVPSNILLNILLISYRCAWCVPSKLWINKMDEIVAGGVLLLLNLLLDFNIFELFCLKLYETVCFAVRIVTVAQLATFLYYRY